MSYIEEKENIINEILSSGKVRPRQSIDYSEFLELYSPYKGRMQEKEFAEILEIAYSNYQKIKHNRTKSKNIKKFAKRTYRKRKEKNNR